MDASRFAYTVCAGYKWLLAPRGTCFLTVQPELTGDLIPHTAGWYTGVQRWDSFYGSPLRLARTPGASMSPRLGTPGSRRPQLWICSTRSAPHTHALGLANRFRAGVDLSPGDSAIVSLATEPDVGALLERAGIVASVRSGRLRLAFHINNSIDDADRAAEALSGQVSL